MWCSCVSSSCWWLILRMTIFTHISMTSFCHLLPPAASHRPCAALVFLHHQCYGWSIPQMHSPTHTCTVQRTRCFSISSNHTYFVSPHSVSWLLKLEVISSFTLQPRSPAVFAHAAAECSDWETSGMQIYVFNCRFIYMTNLSPSVTKMFFLLFSLHLADVISVKIAPDCEGLVFASNYQ